jgi:hypothetical protein
VGRWAQNRRDAKREGEGKWSGQARGGESEAKALAETDAVRAQRGGTRRQGHGARCLRGGEQRFAGPQNAPGGTGGEKRALAPEGQPHATRAMGAAFAAVAGNRGA